jgi:hypothetical protein
MNVCLTCERTQLDQQSRETERFSQRLLGKSPSGLRYRYPSTGSLLDKLELPAVTDYRFEESVLANENSRSQDPTLVLLIFLTMAKRHELSNVAITFTVFG